MQFDVQPFSTFLNPPGIHSPTDRRLDTHQYLGDDFYTGLDMLDNVLDGHPFSYAVFDSRYPGYQNMKPAKIGRGT